MPLLLSRDQLKGREVKLDLKPRPRPEPPAIDPIAATLQKMEAIVAQNQAGQVAMIDAIVETLKRQLAPPEMPKMTSPSDWKFTVVRKAGKLSGVVASCGTMKHTFNVERDAEGKLAGITVK